MVRARPMAWGELGIGDRHQGVSLGVIAQTIRSGRPLLNGDQGEQTMSLIGMSQRQLAQLVSWSGGDLVGLLGGGFRVGRGFGGAGLRRSVIHGETMPHCD